jgi:hypothetical protein
LGCLASATEESPFRSADSAIAKALYRRLPPPPASQATLEFGWQDLRAGLQVYQVLVATITFIAVIICIMSLWDFSPLRHSVFSVVVTVISKLLGWEAGDNTTGSSVGGLTDDSIWDTLGHYLWLVFQLGILLFFVSLFWMLLKRLPQYAIREEQIFRQGSEEWSIAEKIKSCLIFGAIHLSNGIFPFLIPAAVAIALAMTGAVYMAVYLAFCNREQRAGIYASSAVHTIYNLLAIGLFAYFFLAGWLSSMF